jgi:density-regulated protein DRP1
MAEQQESSGKQTQTEASNSNMNMPPKDPRYPLKVVYCGVCGLPPEFCEYGPDFEKCKPWLAQNCPNLYPDLNTRQGQITSVEEKMAETKIEDDSKEKGDAESDEEPDDGKEESKTTNNKKILKTKKGQIISEEEAKNVKILPGGKIKPKESNQILISRSQRAKRKYITTVVGLGSFGVKLTEASKLFAKKFSCGSSPSKTHEDGVEIQGDVSNDIVDFILMQWKDKIKPEQIFFFEEGKKRPAKG